MEQKNPLNSLGLTYPKLPILLGLVTFGLDSIESEKMQIKQSYFQPELNEADKDLSYLNNLQSICYPCGIQCKEIKLKHQKGKSMVVDRSKFIEQSDSSSNLRSIKEHSIVHYSITTCMGLKRYLSILLCKEVASQDKLLITTQLQALPFAFVLISSSPAFKLTRRVLKCIYDQTLHPYYLQVLGCQDESSSPLAVHHPIRLEYQLSTVFNLLNKPSDDHIYSKMIEDQRENKMIVTIEPQNLSEKVFLTPNFTYKQLWNKISPQNLIQLFTCLILERKIILISKDVNINAILIESLLELLSPLDKSVFTNISFIKYEMVDYLDTPLPFIIGISETLWNKIFMSKWNEVSDDTVAFYIDTALLMTKFDLPTPPEPVTRILLQTLIDLQNKQSSMTDVEMQTMLKQAFYNYLLLLINDHRKCFKITYEDSLKQGGGGVESLSLSLENQNLSPRLPVDQLFKFDKYLERQLPDNQDFYSQFMDTQMFNDFIERSFRFKENSENHHLIHFLQCLDIIAEKSDFTEVLYVQQQMINSSIMNLHQNSVVYPLQDVIDSYDRFASSLDSSVFLKTLQFSSGVFKFNEKLICLNMQHEINKQSQIKNIVNKPQSSLKKRPSKKNTTIGKRSLIQQLPFSRNDLNSLPKNNQSSIVSSTYYINGPHNKVQTPKGLPSECMSGKLLIPDDLDNNSNTSNKDQLQSLEETKSETTNSIKSFFQITFQKIQNKLKASLANPDQDDGPSSKTPKGKGAVTETDLFTVDNQKILNLTSLGFYSNDSKENTPKSANTQMKLLYGQQSMVIGPKSGLNMGRPKCFSETISTQFKQRIQQAIPIQNAPILNIQEINQAQNVEQQPRPSAFSISNKSYIDSPKSTTYTAESSSSLSKGRDIQMGIKRTNLDRTLQQQTPLSTTGGGGSGGKHTSQQLAYSIFNQGVVILKEVNKDNIKKRLVKKFNINLDLEDANNKRSQQLYQQNLQMQAQTMNSARSSGQDCSPQDVSMNTQAQSLSGQKIKNQSNNKLNVALSSGKQSGRQKAVSYQINSNTANNTSKHTIAAQQQLAQPKKNSMKQKREEALLKTQIGGVISLKKSSIADKPSSFKTDRKQAQQQPNNSHHQHNFSIASQQASFQMGFCQDSKQEKYPNAIIKKPFDGIEGVQQRMRSISYTNTSEYQIKQRQFKLQKEKSYKDIKISPQQANTQLMFMPVAQKLCRDSDLNVKQFQEHENIQPRLLQSADMMILEPFQLISTNPDYLRQKGSYNDNIMTSSSRLLETEEQDYLLMTSPYPHASKPLQLVLTKQLTLDAPGHAKKGRIRGDTTDSKEPWSPQGKGSQATPNLGDDDMFSPGNKGSMNASYQAENFSTLS